MKIIRSLALLGALTASLLADAPTTTVPAIQTPASPTYFAGKLVWANLYTTDVGAATQFYTRLFGWTAQSDPGHSSRSVMLLGDRPIAGIVTRSAQAGERAHARWVPFGSVPDVAAALQAADAAGAKTLHPVHSVPNRGDQALFEDPQGALFGLVHSSSGDPGEYRADLGEWTWAELFARDPAAAAKFYADVARYEIVPDHRTDDLNRLVLASGGYSRASVLPVPDRPHAHPAWLLFVRVQSVAEMTAKVTGLGGRVISEPKESAAHYVQAIIADPTGGAVGLVELPTEESTP
ncbi:MAG TPA: VOC family protein [Opitutaceae bacterium]